jgi:uncharacterized protein (DUF2235 family)
MKQFKVLILPMVFTIVGCASNTAINHIPISSNEIPRKLAVFLDGTANDEGSHTNIAKLHNLTTLQDKTNINTSYIKGVGTDGEVIGMITGRGIGKDVREAYRFFAENYNYDRGDEIYIFGFSRGAYAARILSALINVAGIQDIQCIPKKDRKEYIKEIYGAYKNKKKTIEERREDVRNVTGHTPVPVKIEFLGLWDTVEALGWPDYKEDVVLENPRYADQLCNIKRAAHAVSIDDDRARIFTPILLTRSYLICQCEVEIDINDVVDEVWFSGAHSDVGGGHKDTNIDGVSLNWMLKKIEPYHLVPSGSKVYADYKGVTHDPESGAFGLIYHKLNRNIPLYTDDTEYNNKRLRIHQSVLDRLSLIPVKKYESEWFKSDKYKKCFQVTEDGYDYLQEKDCFDVVPY